MRATIVTPLGKIFDGDIKEIVLPGREGEFGVLEGHAPLSTTLLPGLITVKTGDKEEYLAINGGFVEVAPEYVNVLVDEAQPIKGSSSTEIAEAIENAKRILREAADGNSILASVEARIESVGRSL